eukprot:g9848.t1
MADDSIPSLGTTKFPVMDPARPRPLLLECLDSAPATAGCYIMQGVDGRNLYIGKSVKLNSRVPSYFSTTDYGGVLPGKNLSRRIAVMTTLVERIEYIATVSGAEALVLEASLIKQHQPPFNFLLKDDKRNYPYVCVTWSELYPRLLITRDRPRRGGGPQDRYYGPFVDPGQLRSTLALVRRVLPLRERARPLYKDKPCLNYDMGLCPGACQGLISEDDYAETVKLAEMVLRGDGGELLSRLKARMESESRAERFERAGEIKEQMALVRGGLLGSALHFSPRGVAAGSIERGLASGGSSSSAEGGGARRDVVAVGLAGGLACFQVFQVRGGRLTGRLGFTYRVEGEGLSRGEVLQACLERYWGDALEWGHGAREGGAGSSPLAGGEREGGGVAVLDVPEEIVTADALPEGGAALLGELLSSARKAAVGAHRQEDGTLLQGEGNHSGGKAEERRGRQVPRVSGAARKKKAATSAVGVKVVHGESGTGERHHLCVMALKNAELEAKRLQQGGEASTRGLSQLAGMLGLRSPPARIEGYDVSHTGGGQAVGSLVCFLEGKASPKDHRRYKIRSPDVRKGHSDDYASLREVIARRFSPPSPDPASPAAPAAGDVIPDLVVVDGGKGQLAAAIEGAAIAAGQWDSAERETATRVNGFGPVGGAPSASAPAAAGDVAARMTALAGETWSEGARDDEGATRSPSTAVPAVEGKEAARLDPDAVLLSTASAAESPNGGEVGDAAAGRSVHVGGGRRVLFVSLAKKEEEVFASGASEPLVAALDAGPTSPGVMILRQVRDEAHRFAVAYHRKLRGNDLFLPERTGEEPDRAWGDGRPRDFEAIAGLSSKARKELAEKFGSLEGARVAGEAELRRIPGVGPVLAKRILA